MNRSESEFLEELRRDFVPEAEECLETIVSGLLDLERGETSQKSVENVFRAAHSLKGAAQAVQMPAISLLCQTMESVFSGMKKGLLHPGKVDYDTLQRAADVLGSMVASSGNDDPRSHQIRKELESLLAAGNTRSGPAFVFQYPQKDGDVQKSGEPKAGETTENEIPVPPGSRESSPVSVAFSAQTHGPASIPSVPDAENASTLKNAHLVQDTVRIGAGKLDELLLKAEELMPVNQILAVRFGELREIRSMLAKWQGEWKKMRDAIRKSGEARRLSPFLRGFLDTGRSRLSEIQEKSGILERALVSDRHAIEGLIGDIVEETRTILMLPCATLLHGFPRIVRDLARDLGKEAELTVEGDSIDVDKRILEGLKDPLIHLVRNAIDHGLEKPGERIARGKPPVGTVSISISSVEGGRVQFRLADDGKGIDVSKVRESAIKTGLLSREEECALNDAAACMLIFRSGVSTTPIITDVSGRGLGMAIVGEKVEALGGTIAVASLPGKGTTFTISLPLTLAAFRGVLVEEWGYHFVIPTASVKYVTRVGRSDIRKIENLETVSLNGVPLALVRLGGLLELPPSRETAEKKKFSIVAAGSGSERIALVVDRIVDEMEVLLKPLGKQLQRVRNISGVTLLGSGEIVPVLNCADLVKSVKKASGPEIASSPTRKESCRKSILVVEDSITSRTLLKNVLNAAGYDVRTAVDGKEAWDMLSKQASHIVVSDVEMPGMNGFELTEKIRSEERFAHLPVVLVTSLESTEDREHGVEAGADAYIVKSGFDQGVLLEVIRRLL